MDQHAFRAGWDLYVFGIPLIAFLVFGFFRLDQVFTAQKKGTAGTACPEPLNKKREKSMHSDPDGRPWDE